MSKKARRGDTKCKLWSQETLVAGIKEVEDGTGLREASRTFNLRVETLRRRVIGAVDIECRPGTATILTKEEEMALFGYTIKMSEMGFGQGQEDVMRAAFQLAEHSGRRHPFHGGTAGRSWMDGFLRCHPPS